MLTPDSAPPAGSSVAAAPPSGDDVDTMIPIAANTPPAIMDSAAITAATAMDRRLRILVSSAEITRRTVTRPSTKDDIAGAAGGAAIVSVAVLVMRRPSGSMWQGQWQARRVGIRCRRG
jgi:hypothetical protein